MSYSADLESLLDDDIETLLPTISQDGQEPVSVLFALSVPRAPIVTLSRDKKMGLVCVPTLFLAIRKSEMLRHLIEPFAEIGGDTVPLFHTSNSRNCGTIVLAPFLFDRLPSAAQFVQKALDIGNALIETDIESAYLITDCHVVVTNQGRVLKPEQFPNVFDHLRRGI